MKRIFLLLAVLVSVSVAQAQTQTVRTPFGDVPPNHWAAHAIEKLAEWGIVIGYPVGQPTAKPIDQPVQFDHKHHVGENKSITKQSGNSTPVK